MTHLKHSPTAVALCLLVSACGSKNTGSPSANAPADNASIERSTPEQLVAADAPTPQPGGYSDISNSQLQKMLDEGVTLIDIRLESEWRQTGIIEGAKPITFFERSGQTNPNFESMLSAAVQLDQPVALICHSGNRTQHASRAIAQLGYKNVFNVTNGILGWVSEERPVVAYP